MWTHSGNRDSLTFLVYAEDVSWLHSRDVRVESKANPKFLIMLRSLLYSIPPSPVGGGWVHLAMLKVCTPYLTKANGIVSP